jgi:hypothetical protein
LFKKWNFSAARFWSIVHTFILGGKSHFYYHCSIGGRP